MSRAIELLVKMYDPKCVSVEAVSRGECVLYKEQILAAFSQAEREYPLGYHMLMLKYRGDTGSRGVINVHISHWLARLGVTQTDAKTALCYLVDMLSDIPLPSQQKRLKSLRNRYQRSQFAHIRAVEKANELAEQGGLNQNSITARKLRVKELNNSRKSTICPRCRGTGEIGRVEKKSCPECEGRGRLKATIWHLVKSLDCSEEYFKLNLNALVIEFEQLLYTEMSNAERVIKVRLRSEK